MGKLTIEVDTDAGTAVVVNSTGQTATPNAPKLLNFDFNTGPKFAGGLVAEDFWMIGKTGAKKGAIYSQWTQYNQITSMMGHVTEFEVVAPPDPANAASANPSNYNANVYRAWDPQIGWVSEAPPREGQYTPEQLQKMWAEYYARFKAAHQRP